MLQICRYLEPGLGARLGASIEGGVYDLTATGQDAFSSFHSWLAWVEELGVQRAATELQAMAGAAKVAHRWEELQRRPDPGTAHLLPPLDLQEVWAAGVTYLRSRDAREEEADHIGIYDKVYVAERPEIFLKATPHRVVGPHDTVAIRADSTWNVPEPELSVLLTSDCQVVGYTVGNDVCSRAIEGENPLYLPQAKIYMRSCALGPAVSLASDFESDRGAGIEMIIRRRQAVAFQGSTTSARMKRSIPELVSYLRRSNAFPHGAYLMTGTGVVPPDAFTLEPGDEVEIHIERIGRLVNLVASWP